MQKESTLSIARVTLAQKCPQGKMTKANATDASADSP